ncbi:hypothetical protein SASPL_133693 [Salvia splendens]|uniref:Major facilitator superfamily (MFS) profile domain-containing protein n=1 Tax=Salvia splendens TaxID=180675 RepID=A0A8X8X642_SALSN|nr:hypothetical protein SASPL_133693 [Salvia splendens]
MGCIRAAIGDTRHGDFVGGRPTNRVGALKSRSCIASAARMTNPSRCSATYGIAVIPTAEEHEFLPHGDWKFGRADPSHLDSNLSNRAMIFSTSAEKISLDPGKARGGLLHSELPRRDHPVDDVEDELADIVLASEAAKQVEKPWSNLLRRKYRPQLVMVVLIPFFQQFTGMNVIMFYAPVLFKTIGFGSNASLASALISGGVNCVATLVSICTVDRLGRRFWFLEGAIQMFICQIIVAICIGAKFGVSGNPGELPVWYAGIVVFAICVYVAGFAWSWGPLGWLVPGEILPLEVRSAGQSVNVSVNMIFTFIIAQCFLRMLCVMKFGLFIFFSGFVLVMALFIYYFLPETKGIPIEDIAEVWKTHPYWKRFVDEDDDVARKNRFSGV